MREPLTESIRPVWVSLATEVADIRQLRRSQRKCVIPYSLWRSNQLWNLLPTSNKVNRDKSDRIPTTSLLLRRRDAIVHCWRLMKKEAQPRFQVEVGRFLGAVETDWEGQLFGRLRESAELTSLQRGVERWEP